jgi:uncharacterized lipoprotein YajG
MKDKILKISVLVIMIIVSVFVLTGCTDTNNTENKTENTTKTVTTQDNKPKTCQHDWVITSRYSFFTNSYKTVSKCSKCGQIIE